MSPSLKVAVVQSEPDWYDLKGSVEKVSRLILEASQNGAELIAFPEVFIPGYPVWLFSNATDIEKNVSYIHNSLSYDSPEFESILTTIKENPINVVLGFSERAQNSVYIAQCIIDKTARVRMKRRKMKPTHVERVLFGDGKSSDLSNVTKLSFNNTPDIEVGCLNCWEHMQPLLTFNSATQHEKVHVGSWPFLYNEGDAFSLQVGGNQILASAYAMQTLSFYLFAAAITTDKIYKKLDKLPELIKAGLGCSAVFAPDGRKISSDLGKDFDGLLYQYLDMNLVVVNKHLIDIVGHYSRTDMMSLNIHDSNENVSQNYLKPT